MLVLYHARTSVCSIKVRLILAEKHLTWHSNLLTLQGDQFDPMHVQLNPNAVVPTLVHNRHIVIDSTVIAYYLNESFPDVALMPCSLKERVKAYGIIKFVDERVHDSCTLLSFATANRARLLRKTDAELEEELRKIPSRAAREAKRQAAKYGLDAPLAVDAVRDYEKLLDKIEIAMQDGPYLAGDTYSLADIVVTPYVWRLEMLRLSSLWEDRSSVGNWYERIRKRPSFTAAVSDWLTPDDIHRYASFEPDPWPKVQDIRCDLRDASHAPV